MKRKTYINAQGRTVQLRINWGNVLMSATALLSLLGVGVLGYLLLELGTR